MTCTCLAYSNLAYLGEISKCTETRATIFCVWPHGWQPKTTVQLYAIVSCTAPQKKKELAHNLPRKLCKNSI